MKYYQHGETGRVVATENELIGEWYEIEKDQYEEALHPSSRPTKDALDLPSACPACGTLPEEAEHDPTCPLATASQ